MIYLIDPTTDKYGHHEVYLNTLLNITDTKALQMKVDIRRIKLNIINIVKYYKALHVQLHAIPKGNLAHILYSDIYYKIPFLSSSLLQRNKTIVTMHSCPNGKIKRWLMKNFCKRVSAVIVHSEFIKEKLNKLGLTNVYYIDYPSFYDYSSLAPRKELRKQAGLTGNDIVLTALGGIRHDKGLDILLEAFKYLDKTEKQRIVLNIAGREGFMNSHQIAELCHTNGIRSRLNIQPLTDKEFMENVEISDYLVMPYRCKMTGNSGPITEAIVRNIPSVVPKGSNLGYIAEHYHVGVTFQQENVMDLAKTITSLVKNPFKISGKYSHKLTQSTFIQKHIELYTLIINQHN